MKGRSIASAVLALCAALCFPDSFSFSADQVKSVLAVGKERTILSGKAHVKSGRLSITAERIEISGKNYSLLYCTGKVEAVDEEKGIKLVAPTLTYDRIRSIALLQGPSILEDRKNHVVLKANWIQDDGDKGITLAQVNVRILKEGLACRSEYAIYRRDDHYLELTGAPRVVKNGDEYKALRMTVDTETEEIKLEGSVSGSVHTENAKADEKNGSASKAATPSASGTTPSDTSVPTRRPGPGGPLQ
jgi:lipopolysaccharide export system protein LptA